MTAKRLVGYLVFGMIGLVAVFSPAIADYFNYNARNVTGDNTGIVTGYTAIQATTGTFTNITGSLTVVDNTFDGTKLLDNTVTNSKIADATIDSTKISSVNGSKLVDNTVTSTKLLDNTVTSTKLLDNTITSTKLLDNTITILKINRTGTADNTTLFRGDGKFDNTLVGGFRVSGMLYQGVVHHAYGGFENAALTTTNNQNAWTAIANPSSPIWTLVEAEGFSNSLDNIVIANVGSYVGNCSITFSGANGDDYWIRAYNVTTAAQIGYHMGVVTTGASNFTEVSFPMYISTVAANTKIRFEIMNISNNDDPLIRSGIFILKYLHD